MEHDEREFDQPVLKDAVRRAWGGDVAPQRLRGRISHLIATASSIDIMPAEASARSRWQIWTSRAYALAAAAVVILAIGLLVLYYMGQFDALGPRRFAGMTSPVAPERTSMPISLARSLVATHRAAGKSLDEQTGDSLDAKTYAELSLKLTADLGFPVLARSVGTDWKFEGAREFTVGDARGSQVLFAHGDETVSLFSLPLQCTGGCSANSTFEAMVDGHPVAGFSRPGVAYALVGSSPSGSLSLASMTAIRDALFGAFDTGGACGISTGGLEELD